MADTHNIQMERISQSSNIQVEGCMTHTHTHTRADRGVFEEGKQLLVFSEESARIIRKSMCRRERCV